MTLEGTDKNSWEDPPLIDSSGGRVTLEGSSLLEFDELRAVGRSCCLVGDFDPLIRWLLREAEMEGVFAIAGMAPHLALRAGALGLSLSSSVWDPEWTVGAALEASGSLVGASRAQVSRALERTRLTRHRATRIGQLNVPLRRLLSLAAAALTEPAVLVLERPFAGLDDEAAQFVETVLGDLTSDRRWIALADVATPWERRLCEHADAGVFVARGGRVVGPFDSQRWLEGPQMFWIHVIGGDAATALRAEGAQVDEGPAPETLIVQGLTGRRIAEVTASAQLKLRELVPLSHAASCY